MSDLFKPEDFNYGKKPAEGIGGPADLAAIANSLHEEKCPYKKAKAENDERWQKGEGSFEVQLDEITKTPPGE